MRWWSGRVMWDIRYLNAGDWVETLSALVENRHGEWEIIYYNEWKAAQDKVAVMLVS